MGEINEELGNVILENACDNFTVFDIPNILKLAEKYPYDFNEDEKRRLPVQLENYIDFLKKDKQFTNLDGLLSLVRFMVSTNIHVTFTLVYRLLKPVLVLRVATATVKRCFSAMKNMKTDLRNRIGDENLSDSCICYIEKVA
ncbi:putative HAT dimerization domain-containing protein [Helianthus annuus]|nr:putative HAT dimerization domain-containing protein [Helianthus annuus]